MKILLQIKFQAYQFASSSSCYCRSPMDKCSSFARYSFGYFFRQATVVITILADGTHWVVDAWVLDIMGFLVGFFLLFNTGNHQIERLTAFGT